MNNVFFYRIKMQLMLMKIILLIIRMKKIQRFGILQLDPLKIVLKNKILVMFTKNNLLKNQHQKKKIKK